MNIFVSITLWIAYVIALYFSIFLLLVYFDNKKMFKKEKSSLFPKKYPLVSVLVPVFNEQNTVLGTLKSIANLDYPKDKLEVIVINDGSTDNTKKIVQEYIKDQDSFKLISHQNRGKGASMNRALEMAKGKFFACLDADSFVDSLTLKKQLSLYYNQNDPRLAIITPAMKVYKPKNILQKIQWIEYLVIILIARIASQLDALYVAPGPFSLYRTSIVRKLGGFDEKSITEDQEIAYRIQKHNYRIKQCFDGYVYTVAPNKIKPFYYQRRRWYLGGVSCLYKYKSMVANKKYGDFGIMQMIKNVIGYLLAVIGIGAFVYIILLPLMTKLKNLLAIKFNILPYILNLELNFSWLNFLMMDFKRSFLVIFILMVGTYLFYQAHKNANERIVRFGWIPLIPYFLFYYLLKGTIFIMSLFQFVRGKKLKW
jgi:cellulose synthase/poly-beta-1,6-N-acetylglucosamine synthase-like glycosyltransferase